MLFHLLDQCLDFFDKPRHPVVFRFVGDIEVVKKVRHDTVVVLAGLAPALIQPAHAIASRRDDSPVKKREFPFSSQLQDTFGKAADKGAEIGIAHFHAFSLYSPQPDGRISAA